MTYLSQLRAELAETNMDVLAPEAAFFVRGGKGKGKGSNKSSGSKSGKSSKKGRKGHGHGHGHGGWGNRCCC